MRRYILLIASLLSFAASAQQSLHWLPKETVSTSMAANRPRVTTNGYAMPVVIWGEGANLIAGVGSQFFFDRVDTLNLPGQMVSISYWHGPELAGTGDTLYAVYKEAPETDTSHHIYCVATFDGGQNWMAPRRVDFIGNHMGRLPTVAKGPGGHPVVAFMLSDLNYMEPQWVIATSSDYGQTFSSPVQVSGDNSPTAEACDCCPAALAVTGSTVHLAYRDNLSNVRNIRVASGLWQDSVYTSMDVDPQTWTVNACPASGPDITNLGDSLFATFLNASQSDDVFLSRWQQGDSTVAIQEISTSSLAQNYPRIDAQLWSDGSSTRSSVWKTGAGTQAKIQAKIEHWGLPFWVDLDTGTVNVPDVAVSGQGVYFVWHEVLQKRIYLKRAYFQGIGLEEVPTLTDRTLTHIFDLHGRQVDPANLPAGVYIFWYSDGSFEKTFILAD
jgi:hypothetical protein